MTIAALADDAVVLVTGSGGGLGGAMARGLLQAGRRVVAIDLETARPSLDALEADVAANHARDRIFCLTANIRSEHDCERTVARAIEHFGAIHALVNNAGIGMSSLSLAAQDARVPFYQLPPDFWRTLFDTNVTGSFLMSRAVTPHLVTQGCGRIINITTGARAMVRGGFTPYGPAKAAMDAATAAWAEELAGSGVTINALSPGGAADTPMIPHAFVEDRSTLVAPRVMVAPVVWLTSADAGEFTGMRVVATDWDPDRRPDENVAKCGRAGWA